MLIFSLWILASLCSLFSLGCVAASASLGWQLYGRVSGTDRLKMAIVFVMFLLQVANAVLAWHCERFWQ